MSAQARPLLGAFDRCPRCHQHREGDAPCPNCRDGLDLELALPPLVVLAPEEVNGHVFLNGETACEFCGCPLARAAGSSCG